MKNCARLAALLMAWAVCSPFLATAQNAKIAFLENDLEAAKRQAAASEKLILLKFSARWCLPCRLMDEHVWPVDELAQAVSANCVAVSVDIENLDGIGLKQHFLVETLPTIALLNACGETLVRFETACTASQILEQIRFFDEPENRFCPADPLRSEPFAGQKNEAKKAAPERSPRFLPQPVFRSRPEFFETQTVAAAEHFSMPFDLPMH